MIKNYKKGFTLIELLVVASIISLLSSVVLSSVNTAKQKADDTRRVSDIKEIASAINMYYSDNGNYPSSASTCSGATGPQDWPAAFKSALVPKYIKSLPLDPKHSQAICTGSSFNYYYTFVNPITWTWGSCTAATQDIVLASIGRSNGKVFQNACNISGSYINTIIFKK